MTSHDPQRCGTMSYISVCDDGERVALTREEVEETRQPPTLVLHSAYLAHILEGRCDLGSWLAAEADQWQESMTESKEMM